MEYVLALLTIGVVFVLPTLIVMGLVAKPQQSRADVLPTEPRPPATVHGQPVDHEGSTA